MHIVQSPEWGEFKTSMGTTAIRAGGVQYTKHKIPFTNFFYGYSPRVNPIDIDWGALKTSLQENSCVAVNFDVPNVIALTPEAEKAVETFDAQRCPIAPRSTFARANVLLDISKSEEELLAQMHKKHRYNIKYAEKQGVVVRRGKTLADFEIFYSLLSETAKRQHYFVHPREYYQKLWEMFSEKGLVHLLIAEKNGEPLTAWMLFTYEGVLYYPFGGSSEKQKNLQHSLAVAWEAIRLGQQKGCKLFDMWGAAEIPVDETDPWFGFTQFKMRFGGQFVRYIDSRDFVVNAPIYKLFNLANNLRWKILNLIK